VFFFHNFRFLSNNNIVFHQVFDVAAKYTQHKESGSIYNFNDFSSCITYHNDEKSAEGASEINGKYCMIEAAKAGDASKIFFSGNYSNTYLILNLILKEFFKDSAFRKHVMTKQSHQY
jgi:Nose resistant-to-fluoxetine protein, N-terminal domain